MRCPACNHKKTFVLESRMVKQDTVLKRRRECQKCGNRFTTYERFEMTKYTTNFDENERFFTRSDILKGVRKVCNQTGVSTAFFNKLADEIEVEMKKNQKISPKEIGDIVLRIINELPPETIGRFLVSLFF